MVLYRILQTKRAKLGRSSGRILLRSISRYIVWLTVRVDTKVLDVDDAESEQYLRYGIVSRGCHRYTLHFRLARTTSPALIIQRRFVNGRQQA
jgi:hypothetical protein